MTNSKKIRVYVVDYGRTYLNLVWKDPATGKRKSESSKCKARGPAERKALDKERQLNATVPTGDGSQDWKAFVSIYSHQHLSGGDYATERWHLAKLNVYETKMKPSTVGDLSAPNLSIYVGKLRTLGRSEDTVRGHMIAIKCALDWAKTQGLISEVPAFPAVRTRGKKRKVKGRDLTIWEFCRMLSVIKDELKPIQVPSWRHFLLGLWLSGLRLSEGLNLSWDDPTAPRINLDGEYPMLEIDAEDDKGRQHRILPIVPDFGRWLLRVPEDQRHGRLFSPIGEKGEPLRSESLISRTISAIGKRANIIVDHRRLKYASAHDLRRTFGTRWSKEVPPIELQQLMRHEQLSTTMTYYVGQNAQAVTANLWKKKKR